MKILIDLTIKYGKKDGKNRYRYDLIYNSEKIDYCVVVPDIEFIAVDFLPDHLRLLGIKVKDFESYNKRFEYYGINLKDVK